MSELSLDQFNIKLTNFANKIIDANLPLEKAVLDIAPKIADRIFNQGKKTDESQIGQYDTTLEMYINPNYTPAAVAARGSRTKFPTEGLKPTRGKPGAYLTEDSQGEHIFTEKTKHRGVKGTKAGDPHRTTYVKNYKDFRNRIGRRIDFVNLNLSNELESDFKTSNPVKISSHEYVVKVKRPLSAKKVEGQEDRYGRIFALSQKEKQHFIETLNFEINELIK